MKEILLTQNQVALVSDEDYEDVAPVAHVASIRLRSLAVGMSLFRHSANDTLAAFCIASPLLPRAILAGEFHLVTFCVFWCHNFTSSVRTSRSSKYFLHARHQYFPSVVLFGISTAFVVVQAMLIERPTQPTITYAMSSEPQKVQGGIGIVSK